MERMSSVTHDDHLLFASIERAIQHLSLIQDQKIAIIAVTTNAAISAAPDFNFLESEASDTGTATILVCMLSEVAVKVVNTPLTTAVPVVVTVDPIKNVDSLTRGTPL